MIAVIIGLLATGFWLQRQNATEQERLADEAVESASAAATAQAEAEENAARATENEKLAEKEAAAALEAQQETEIAKGYSINSQLDLDGVAVSPDSHFLITDDDTTIRIWDLSDLNPDSKPTIIDKDIVGQIQGLTISQDNKWLVGYTTESFGIDDSVEPRVMFLDLAKIPNTEP